MATQLYNFLQNLSEEARGCDNVVMAVSIPMSELEMSAEDQSDYERFKKLLDRLGKAVFMSAETETSEIIRRRLFEWNGVPDDGKKVVAEYADWVLDHRQQIPNWFPIDNAREAFEATYPFHPMVLSVFERKWRALPRFQETRGILRLLALWVSRAYPEGYKGNHRDPLIGLGTTPLDDPLFRAAAFEQLGEPKLEGAVTTDICGKNDAHALRLDKEAVETIKKTRLHRKVATTIFFESNGGQSRTEATIPEIRLSVAEPDLDIGNVETVLESLTEACYYLTVERNRYHFSFKENLNKRFADRRASIQLPRIDELVSEEIRKVFAEGTGMERVFFPEKSNNISDRPVLTLVVLAPDRSMAEDPKTLHTVEAMTRECGNSARTFKSALIWMLADTPAPLREEARKVLAWEAIQDEEEDIRLDETQKKQLSENLKKARRDLKECVWRTYKNMALLGKDNAIRVVDLGLVHSSVAGNMLTFILTRLRQDGDLEADISPNFLVRNWPPAFQEWSTRSVRDAFFASPQFPRLLNPDGLKETIARGVSNDFLAYVGKTGSGAYEPFCYGGTLNAGDVEISDDTFILKKEAAESYRKARAASAAGPGATPTPAGTPTKEESVTPIPGAGEGVSEGPGVLDTPPTPPPTIRKLAWKGEIPSQKWMNFYTKVLSKFAREMNLKISIQFEVTQEDGVSPQKIEEAKTALRELGLGDDVGVE